MNRIFAGLAVVGLAISIGFAVFPRQDADAASRLEGQISGNWEQLASPTDGGAVTSPVFQSAADCSSVEVLADNTMVPTTTTRTLAVQWIGKDSSTVLYERDISIDAGYRMAVLVDPHASAATAAGEKVIPMAPGKLMKFSLGAGAGGTAGSLAYYCRP